MQGQKQKSSERSNACWVWGEGGGLMGNAMETTHSNGETWPSPEEGSPSPSPPKTCLWRHAQRTFFCPWPHTKHMGSSICTPLLNSNHSVIWSMIKFFCLCGENKAIHCLLQQLLSLISSEVASPTSCVFCWQCAPSIPVIPHTSTRIFIWISCEIKKNVANRLHISWGILMTGQAEGQRGKERKTSSCHRLCWKLWGLVSSCQQSPVSPLSHDCWAFWSLFLYARLSAGIRN